jgi:hypothetical protein
MYIPERLLEWHERVQMKVQKMVSLDEVTAKIAQRMSNFSQWVRIGLRQYELQEDLASETMRRMRWAKAAHMLAATIHEKALEIDEDYTGTVEDLITKAMEQRTLEEFQ